MIDVKEFNNWDEVFKYLAEKSYKTGNPSPDVVIKTSSLMSPKFMGRFRSASRMSFKLGSDYVFRDKRNTESLHVRVYNDGEPHERFGELSTDIDEPIYYVELDQFNPQSGVSESIAHLYMDVLKLPNPYSR
jgi:hypothetical protein